MAKRRKKASPPPSRCGACHGDGFLLSEGRTPGENRLKRCDACRDYSSDLIAADAQFERFRVEEGVVYVRRQDRRGPIDVLVVVMGGGTQVDVFRPGLRVGIKDYDDGVGMVDSDPALRRDLDGKPYRWDTVESF